jgi:hypothetical protein
MEYKRVKMTDLKGCTRLDFNTLRATPRKDNVFFNLKRLTFGNKIFKQFLFYNNIFTKSNMSLTIWLARPRRRKNSRC